MIEPTDDGVELLAPTGVRPFLAALGLASFAVALPLVRLLADAPEFFIAHDLGPGATVGYLAVVVLVVPLALAALASVPGPAGRVRRTVVLALLGAVATAGVLQPLGAATVVFAVIVLAGTAFVVATERRNPAFRNALAILAVGPLLLGAWAVGPSRTGSYVRSGQAEVLSTTAATTPPIVVIVLDELPLTALLDGDLRIDPERFPNFAALAATSDWYRLASSVSPQTSESVPALLSGVAPAPGTVPVASSYPSSLFLQLAGTYEVRSSEVITAICPDSVCDAPVPEPVEPDADPDADDGPSLLEDTAVVFGHAVGTDDLRRDLPSISQGWAGFADTIEVADAGSGGTVPEDRHGTLPAEGRRLLELLAAPATSERPQLRVAHLIAPHLPWVAVPDGSTYDGAEPTGLSVVDGSLAWGDDEADRRQGYQRLQLQLGALDRQLGAARAVLEEAGTWDGSLVAVTADHGTQFEPGALRSITAGGVEVSAVPLLIKAPGQRKGRIDDRAALTIDLVPTLLGTAGVRSPSRFDGLDLTRADVPTQRVDAFVAGGATTPEQSLDALGSLVERRRAWIDPDGGWDAVYQPGIAEPVVGRDLVALGPSVPGGGTWSRRAGQAGSRVSATIAPAAGVAATSAVYACGGVVAGAQPLVVGQLDLDLFVDHVRCGDEAGTLALVDAAGDVHPLEQTA